MEPLTLFLSFDDMQILNSIFEPYLIMCRDHFHINAGKF